MKRLLFLIFVSAACMTSWAVEASQMRAQDLESGVMTWVAKQQSLPSDQVQVIPIDQRVKLKNCEKEIKYSFPFNNAETVKISCLQPNWQLFVRVLLPNSASRLMAGGQNSSASSTGASLSRQVWVVEQHLSSGSVVQKNQVVLVERDPQWVGNAALDAKADLSFMEASRDLSPGTILRQHDLRPMTLVKRGQMVQIMIGQGQGFQIAARVEAMQDGRYGEQIKLKNPESGRIMSGVVKGPGMVTGT